MPVPNPLPVTFRKYEKNGFPTPSGKMEFASSHPREALRPPRHRRPAGVQRAQAQPGLHPRAGRGVPAGPRHRLPAAHVHALAHVPAPLDPQPAARRAAPTSTRPTRAASASPRATWSSCRPRTGSIRVKANLTELARPEDVAHMYHDYPEADVNSSAPGRLPRSDLRFPRLQGPALRGQEDRADCRRAAQEVTR